jgi:hypothetical protein
MCELLVGLPDVDVVGVEDEVLGPLRVYLRCRDRDRWCRECGVRAESKGRPKIELVDLPVLGVEPGWCGTNTGGSALSQSARGFMDKV